MLFSLVLLVLAACAGYPPPIRILPAEILAAFPTLQSLVERLTA